MQRIALPLLLLAIILACNALPAWGTDSNSPGFQLPSPPAGATIVKMPTPTTPATQTPGPTNTPVPLTRPRGDSLSGTYSISRRDGGGCVVKLMVESPAPSMDQVGIEIFCMLGAPSYNSGWAMDRVQVVDDTAVLSPGLACSLVFDFAADQVEVTQIGSPADCGFGANVFADGIYRSIDKKPPVLGCMRLDNPCNVPVATPQ